ncbi:hypothetical protein [Geitlerinema sp. PCC 9228]|jgi:hypothetical protein|uniref:slr1601 family putative cell division protein n=1 Tax=Geitlerinema sp. PCC 9228 TaxID=111611 RepID=UPI0008F9B685|nr:hypothetical protein [Geitlerinema sp. PCC 9228]
MNALKTPPQVVEATPNRRVSHRRPRKRSQTHPSRQPQAKKATSHRTAALEATTKIAVNTLISVVAVSALAHLLPYQRQGYQQLQEMQGYLEKQESEVETLRSQFQRSFAPSATKRVMQEQTYLQDPQRRRILFKEGNQSNHRFSTEPFSQSPQ